MQLSIPLCDIADATDSKSDADFFATNGYLVLKSAFSEDLINDTAEWTQKRFWSDSGEQLLFPRLQDEWKDCELVKRIATNETILQKLQELYGRLPIPFQTLSFPVGTQQRTHSDTIHFHCFPQRFMCGVWVALEDVHEGNGPLHYYPGSHRLPVLQCPDVGIDRSSVPGGPANPPENQKYRFYEDAIQELIGIAGLSKSVTELSKGDALIWAANLLHGGEPIKEPGATRFSQVTHYYFEGCRFYTPLLSDFPGKYIHTRVNITDIRTGSVVAQSGVVEPSIEVAEDGLFARAGRRVDRIIRRIRN